MSVEIVGGSLYDNSNNELEITCGGYYQLNDYYVIILKNVIPKSSSPLVLNLKFTGLLFQTETGIFDIPYSDGEERYSILILSTLMIRIFISPRILFV